jgi:MFS family permease
MVGHDQKWYVTLGLSLMPVFFYALFRFSIGLVLPEITKEFSLDPLSAGFLISASLAATTATTGLAGILADRIGERLVLFSGLLTYAAGLGGAMLAPRFDTFTLFVIVNGLGSGLMVTPAYSVVGVMMPRSRGLGIGAVSGLYNLGGFVGPAFTSILLTAYGWKLPFSIFSAAGFVAAILLVAFLRVPPRVESAGRRRGKPVGRLAFLARRNIVVVCVAMLLSDLAFLAFLSWTPTFMRQQLGMTAEATGLAFGSAIAVGALGVISMGYVFDRIGGKKTTIICGSSSAILTFAFFLQPTVSAMAVTLLLAGGFITNTFWSLLSALAQVGVEDHQLGTVTGLVQNVGFIGAMVGPSIVGSIVRAMPLSEALILSVSLPFLAYAIIMLLYRT